MASNVAVKIIADTSDLSSQCAVAKAQVNALTSEFNSLARQLVATGDPTGALAGKMQALSPQVQAATDKFKGLRAEITGGASPMSAFSGAANAAREAMGLFGVALGAEAIVEFGKNVFEASEQIYHEAEVLGMTTTAYQAFAESGKIAGVSVDTIDTAIRKFVASQGTALTGTGNQAKAFNDLGVSAKLPAEDALPAVARALLAIADPARRARDEVALFGKSGEELNPLLETWAEGVSALTAKMSALGLIQSNDVVKGAHDAQSEMTKSWDQIKTAVSPVVLALEHSVTGLTMGFQRLINLPWGQLASDLANSVANAQLSQIGQSLPSGAGAGGTAEPAKPFAYNAPPAPSPRPNFTDSADAKKAADQARQIADQTAQAYEQGNLRHIESEAQTNSSLLEMGEETLDQWKAQAVDLENSRYSTELAGIQAREAADKGNAVKEAQDQAQEAQLYQEHTDRLTAIDQEYNQKKKALDQAAFQDFLTQEDAKLAAAVQSLNKQYTSQEISADQRHSSEVTLTLAIEAEVLKRFDAENAGLVAGTTAYEEAMRQRAELVQKFGKDVVTADNNYSRLDAQTWSGVNKEILSGENSLINGFISGRQTLGASLLQVTSQFLTRELDADIDYWTERLLLATETTGKEKITEQGGLLVKLMGNQELVANTGVAQAQQTAIVQAGENAKVQATLAANAAIAASDTSTSVTSGKAAYAGYFGAIEADAAKAFADVYAWASPALGPLAAIPAAGAYAVVAAKTALIPSFDIGSNYVPSTGLAMVHQGERILPAADNSQLMSALNGGGAGGGDTYNISVPISGNFSDGDSFGRKVGNAIAQQIRLNNPNMRLANYS
jgi:hypothetical protein